MDILLKKIHQLPQELIDNIFIFTNFSIAVTYNNQWAIKKFYNPNIHTYLWSVHNNQLNIIKWLWCRRK